MLECLENRQHISGSATHSICSDFRIIVIAVFYTCLANRNRRNVFDLYTVVLFQDKLYEDVNNLKLVDVVFKYTQVDV